MIGEHRVTVVAYEDETVTVDMSCLIDDVSVTHGRTNTTEQPDASACTVNFTVDALDAPLPDVVDIGARVTVTTYSDGLPCVRFDGRITDVSLAWDEAGARTPDTGTGQLTAVNVLGDLGHRYVGDEPWPRELDGTRAARVAALAGITLDPEWSDPGVVDLLPRDVDRASALDVMRDAATSGGGMVWATRDGQLRYADAEHRRGAQPSYDLDACDVLVTPTWTRTLDGLTNEVSVSYGPEPEEGGEQARIYAINSRSQARYGRFTTSLTTQIAEQADAEYAAELLLLRNQTPVWILAALPIDVVDLDAADTARLLWLDVHDLIRLTGMPNLGTAPVATTLWVEGFTERLAWGVHEIELVVSGYCRTSLPPHWDNVDPARTWDTVGVALTWDDAYCLGPQPSLGRWNDTPATLRWNRIDPAVTWETWHQEFTRGTYDYA